MKNNRYIILGDSISEGIGKKKINYEFFLNEKYNNGREFINFAKTGTTIKYANEIFEKILKEKPNYAIIFYGNVDAQIRANIWGNRFNINRFIPKRYKRNGMLDPRPFYSKKLYRIVPDRLDNILRYVLKKIVILFEGTIQWVPIDIFLKEYTELILNLKKNSIVPIIISTVYLDDNYFLNSNKEYQKYNSILRKISVEYNCIYIDLYTKLKEHVLKERGFKKLYSYDHFHPNLNGYKFISDVIYEEINKIN